MLKKMMILSMATMMMVGSTAFADEVLVEEAPIEDKVIVEDIAITEADSEASVVEEVVIDEDEALVEQVLSPLDGIIAQIDPELIKEDATTDDIIDLAIELGLTDEDGNLYTKELLEAMVPETPEGEEALVLNKALERVAMAKELGITPGKLNLIQKLDASYGEEAEFDVEAWKDMPVKDIMKTIKENRKAKKVSEEEDALDVELEKIEALMEADDTLAEEALDVEEDKLEIEKESEEKVEKEKVEKKSSEKKEKSSEKSGGSKKSSGKGKNK